MILAMFCLWISGFGFVFRDSLFTHDESKPELSAAEREEVQNKKNSKRKEMADRLKAVLDDANTPQDVSSDAKPLSNETEVQKSAQDKSVILRTGWVSIIGPGGRQMAKLQAALMGNGWIAMPTRALYGGSQWTVSRDDGSTAEIASGIWNKGRVVSLWQLASFTEHEGEASLAQWVADAPLAWMSIESQKEILDIQLMPGSRQGYFVVCPLPLDIKEFGVFIQQESIVGWSFGAWLDNVYLWNGPVGSRIVANSDVRNFYDQTFANGREEKFALALSMKANNSSLERLKALVDGFSRQPKLPLNDTPDFLRVDVVGKLLKQLAEELIHQGQGAQLVDILNDDILREIGDIKLLLDLIPVITSTQGIEPAIIKLETLGKDLVEKGGVDVPAVNELHLKLYQDWLQSLVTVKSLVEAAQVLAKAKAYYPNDPYVHLLGVELALLNGDWQGAERLISMMEYPAAMQDRYELLARKISELKGDEGTVVIRFVAGSNRIPVTSELNQSIRQSFLVDTGASLVTIPSATAESLGLRPVRGGHWDSHSVSTAGGVISATEVLIETLEIEGWVENNVSALVIDIPDQPGVGLLGMNYLSRFRMDLNTREGKLSLRPK
ncbi:MAG: TIGR02281 family clan AA aspartic protease [Proteobacteria bacterium]|nr:TIGR02281 family clan AA aspartic protease [Desulfobulbaceae bacterium]MBU4153394.1 TIGR02281 family clan AA aspartic protease [Pseudomonadota bacterium]